MFDGDADRAAVASVLAGDREAYNGIVHRYKDIVFGAVRAIVRNYHTAEDLTQETFTDGYIKLKSLEEPDKICAWLVRMAKNKCYNHHARSAARFETELHDYVVDQVAPAPEDFLIAQEEQTELRAAVGKLPELQRAVVEMYYFDDLPQNTIAKLLKIPVGTVGRRLHDAKLKLKKELGHMDNINDNNKTTVGKEFEKQVADKVKAIQGYYHLHNNSYDGFENEFDRTVELIDRLPESTEKHAAYADVFLVASWQDKKHQDRALREAELSENGQVMADVLINKHINGDPDEFVSLIEETVPKIKKMPETPDNSNAIGKLLFWRGATKFMQGWHEVGTGKLNEAKENFVDAKKHLKKIDAYYPNAIAGIKAVEIAMDDAEKHVGMTYGVCGEGYRYENGKLLFAQQPGFGHSTSDINRYDSLFCYASFIFQRVFFDENMDIGDVVAGEKGSTSTLVAKNETVSVLAGEFCDCLHIRLHGVWHKNYEAEVYYAKGVGLVKAEFVEGDKVENYELSEYKIGEGNAGSEYFPFAVGNTWKYINTNLSPIYRQTIEYELVNIHPDEKGVYANFTSVHCVRLKKIDGYSDGYDSDAYINLAQKSLPHDKPQQWDFEAAIKYLKYAVRRNSSEKSALFALNALNHVATTKDHVEKNKYRFLPSHLYASLLKKKDGKIVEYAEGGGGYSVSAYRWGSRHEENKIFGVKPFRYLKQLAGTLFDDTWIIGYTGQKKHEDGDVSITVENGGTVAVRAGTFDNCLKVTFSLEKEDNGDIHYYLHNFQNTHCGTKIYYYAPNVGIVKFDCIWGKSLSSVCELAEYSSVATEGEYMPVYIGSRWVYDETTLEPGYRARKRYDVVSGMEDEFFMIDEQEFLYLGTEEEYEKFKKSLEK